MQDPFYFDHENAVCGKSRSSFNIIMFVVEAAIEEHRKSPNIFSYLAGAQYHETDRLKYHLKLCSENPRH